MYRNIGYGYYFIGAVKEEEIQKMEERREIMYRMGLVQQYRRSRGEDYNIEMIHDNNNNNNIEDEFQMDINHYYQYVH